MKWKKFTIQTTTAAEDFISEKLSEIGIEGIEIEDKVEQMIQRACLLMYCQI